MTPEQRELINRAVEFIAAHVKTYGQFLDASDNSEFAAYEIIDLTEESVPVTIQNVVADKVLKASSWPQGTVRTVKDYFNLRY
jgi:hypothetical protein